ncbi:MAG TPA: lysyl oxidase family protein [Actinomycetota bacterium]|nr:lysyl oxidase family protein [Actinomycetota bacterium]
MQTPPRLFGRPARALVAALVAALPALLAGGSAFGAPAPWVRPDLVPQPPEEVVGPTTGFSIGLGVDAPFLVNGCYAEERVRKGAARCLRFDTIVGNAGAGAFELAYMLHKRHVVSATQRVYRSDGSFGDRFAVRSELHPTHAHFHVQDFYTSRLWTAGPGGERVGEAPVARGDKNGFCPEDTRPLEGPDDPGGRHYACFTRDEPDQRGFQVVGISAGWQDVYTAALPDQFVEITGVPDGRYVLEIELDPHNVFVESDDTNNKVCTLIALKGTDAELLEPQVPC